MSEKMGLSAPLLGAKYEYEYRDTGGAWSTITRMPGGANTPTIGFTAPPADELRITATTANSTAIDRIHLAGVSIASGLVFDSSSGLSSEAQPTITRPDSTNHYTFRVSTETATTHTLTITGIAQAKIDIRQIFFAKLDWQPTGQSANYNNGSPRDTGEAYINQSTLSFNQQKRDGGGRVEALSLSGLTEDSILDLTYLEKTKTVGQFCLFERDADSVSVRQDYCLAVTIQTTDINPESINTFSATLNIKEAFVT